MERSNNTLAKLLAIQNEVNEMDSYLTALEAGQTVRIMSANTFENTSDASFSDFLTKEELQRINRDFLKDLTKGVECDTLDYALAASSGILCGLIDILFVNTPHESLIGKSVDDLFDQSIIRLAGPKPNKSGDDAKRSIASAIGFFEQKAHISYDQAKTQEITKQLADGFTDTIYHLSAKNHHAKSLSHYPDIFGLISSICNQWTQTSTFLDSDRGRITIINGDSSIELLGDTISAKIFCGFVNWLMHCISDMAGSSGSRREDGHLGMGLPVPFTEFFQLCNFGTFRSNKDQYQTLATVMAKVYEEGYDFRHGVATSLPVILNDLIIRVIYIFKQHFHNKRGWNELLINNNDPVLQRMFTTGTGCLCLLDLSEAALTSWGNWVVFFSHLNVTAWTRLGLQGLSELKMICNREMHNLELIQDDIDQEWQRILKSSELLLMSDNGQS